MPLKECWITVSSSQLGFVVHQGCLELMKEALGRDKSGIEVLRSIKILADTLRALWPVPEATRNHGLRGMAFDSLSHFTRSTMTSGFESDLLITLEHLRKLPTELQSHIIDLSFPSALTTLWTVQKTAMFLAYPPDVVQSPRSLCAPADVRVLRGKLMGQEYVVKIEACSTDHHPRTLFASYDGIGCTSLSFKPGRDIRPGIWHRVIPPEMQQDLLVYHKVLLNLDVHGAF